MSFDLNNIILFFYTIFYVYLSFADLPQYFIPELQVD